MIEKLKKLYGQLAACDITLMLHAENETYHEFALDLKKRQSCLDQIEDLLRHLTENLSEADLAFIRESHLNALSRGKKIVAVIASLRNISREDMFKCAGGYQGHSIFQKTPPKRRISA